MTYDFTPAVIATVTEADGGASPTKRRYDFNVDEDTFDAAKRPSPGKKMKINIVANANEVIDISQDSD